MTSSVRLVMALAVYRQEGWRGVGSFPSARLSDSGFQMKTPPEVKPLRINVGCGATPTLGWLNLDNSLTVAFKAFLPGRFAKAAREGGVRYANSMRLPAASRSADVVYSSHMLEHMDRSEAPRFLAEAKRVLRPGGIIRLALPDIKMRVDAYLKHGDADEFVHATRMGTQRPHTFRAWLKLAVIGPRHHLWMYDGASASRLLVKVGFERPVVLPAGQTTISGPGPLDLSERDEESFYVEAVKPARSA